MDKEILEFAEKLIVHVRDRSILNCIMSLSKDSKYAQALRWQENLEADANKKLMEEIIPDCVDETIFFLLNSIDNKLINLSFTTDSGKTVDLSEEGFGEMGGWYIRTDSWREKYSKQRVNDDLKDQSLENLNM